MCNKPIHVANICLIFYDHEELQYGIIQRYISATANCF